MKKKILIISQTFYPENFPRSFRTTELAKEFTRQGHDVTVLIPKNDNIHNTFEKKHNIQIKDLGKQVFPSINKRTGNKMIRMIKRISARILFQLFDYPYGYMMFQVKKALKNEKGYDLLISIAVPFPIHWGVAWARNKNHTISKTWVADCGDPFYLSTTDSFKKFFYFKYLEKWFSRKADFISIPFEELKKYFFREFKEKYRVIPQGFDFKDMLITDKPINNEIVTFGFAGGFIKEKRDPRKFLDFLCTVDVPFKFILYNKQNEFTDNYRKILGDKLIVKDYIPRKELLFELSKMDFLVNIELASNQAPSKLIDYSLVKRPILMIKNKEFNKEIILEFLNKDYQNQFIYPDINKYNIVNVCQQFLDLTD